MSDMDDRIRITALEQARATYNAACKVYHPICRAYRDGAISTDEYIAARRVYEAAGDTYDAAIEAAKGGAR